MTQSPANSSSSKGKSLTILEYALLALCLCSLALRTTYAESPTAHTLSLPANLADTIYSLSVSAVLIFSFILWLTWSLCSRRFIYRVSGIEIGLGIFCVAALISAIAASDKRLAITNVAMLLAPVFAALLLVQLLDSPSKIRLVLITVAALGVASAYECADQFFVGNQMTIEQYQESPQTVLEPLGIEPGTLQHFLFEHRLYSGAVRGFFTTANSVGSLLIMALFAAVALLLPKLSRRTSQASQTRYIAAAAFAVVVLASALILTRSKGALLSVLFAAGLFVIALRFPDWLRAKRKILLIVCLLLAVAGGCLVTCYGLKHGRLPGGNSMLVRWQYWHASAKMFLDHPLAGVGPGNFTHFYPHYKPDSAPESVSDPHSFPLSILTQCGPLGLLGFLSMILIPLYRTLCATLTDSRPPPDNRTNAAGKMTTTLLLVISAVLLLVRPLLVRTTPTGNLAIIIYTIVVLYVTPAAAFIIGFLLLAAPIAPSRSAKYNIGDILTSKIAILCSLLGVLVHNLIDFAIFEPGVATTFWALVACLVALNAYQKRLCPIVLTPAPFARLLAPAAGLILLAAYTAYAWLPVYKSTTKIIRAQHAASIGQFQHAHNLLDAAATADPLSPTPFNFNGRLYLQRYQDYHEPDTALLENAKTCFANAIQRSQADYKNYEKLSTVCTLLGQKQQAYDWGIKATQLYGGCDRLWFNLAKIAEQLNKPDLALRHYEKAVEIEDSYRSQFRIMYPQRKEVVSRLGEQNYQFAKQRIEDLTK